MIFTLRRVDAKDLVTQAGAGLPKSKQRPSAGKVLDDALLADVFGIEMAEVAPAIRRAGPRRKSTATNVAKTLGNGTSTASRNASTGGKTAATKKTAAAQKPIAANVAALSASMRKSKTSKAKTVAPTTAPKARLR